MRNIARRLYRALPFKRPVFELVRQLVRLPEPLYRHLHFEGVIDVPVNGGSFRMAHHGTQIENEVFWSGLYGRWEGPSLRMWVRAARDAAAILDVGSNAGLYTLTAKAVMPHASVAAIEPVERFSGPRVSLDSQSWNAERSILTGGYGLTSGKAYPTLTWRTPRAGKTRGR